MTVDHLAFPWPPFHPQTRSSLQAGLPLVLAVSGGADSMALLHAVVEAALLPRDKILVGHFDHRLRADSREDGWFVQEACHALGMACRVGQWARPPGGTGNLPERARRARYEFLATAARQWGAGSIAVAHHQDDQAETFLDHLLRGSGVKGLAAMAPCRAMAPGLTLLRPMLDWRRGQIRQGLAQRRLSWREDPGNTVTTRLRGRLRHQVLPQLDQVLGRELTPLLGATAQRLGEADAALEWMVTRCWPALEVRRTGAGLALLAAELANWPDELVVRVVQRCRQMLSDGLHPLSQKANQGILARLRTPHRAWVVEVQGVTVAKEGSHILITLGRQRPDSATR